MSVEETPEKTTVSLDEVYRQPFLPEFSPPSGSPQSQPELCSELAPVRALMRELDQRLRIASDLFGDNVSALGMALARLEALEAGFSELLALEPQDLGDFSDDD